MVANAAQMLNESAEIERMNKLFEAQKQAFNNMPMPTAEYRIDALKRLKAAVIKHQDILADAINQDYGCRAKGDTKIAEILTTVEGINMALHNTKKWMKPSKRKVGMLFAPATNEVVYQPLGVVGIIVPWNYPIFLALGPLLAALSAGNRALVKMSEFTPHTNAALKKMLAECFAEDEVALIEGEVETAVEFSNLPFNHMFFTGSTAVGRHIMAAAAKNLTPVTLELGGKSPAIIAPTANMKDAAERICFGKTLNAAQTCVAPDYVLCPAGREEEFINEFKNTFKGMYPTIKNNQDYTSIVNDRQYERLTGWLADAIEKGARITEINPANEDLTGTRKIAPTMIQGGTDDMTVMQQELFGPILPIISYTNIDEAIAYVNERPRPLALYYFGYDKSQQDYVLNKTHSGGVSVNDTLVHLAQEDMPFGGVGDSGMGGYHGHDGFLTFSHAKSIHRKGKFNSGKLAYPPYNRLIHSLIYKFFIR